MDTFTLVAQVVNFLVLVALLRRFLYRPLLQVMDEREERFARRQAEADARVAEAEALVAGTRAEREALERARAGLMARAEMEAAEHRRTLLEEVRQEVAARQEEWLEDLRRGRVATLDSLRPRLAAILAALCQRALEDLAGEDLEDRMALRLADRLALPGALPAEGPVRIASARPLGPGARGALQGALAPRPVEFSVAGFQDRGVRASAGGWEAAWTLASHREALEERVRVLLEEEAGRAVAAPA